MEIVSLITKAAEGRSDFDKGGLALMDLALFSEM